MKNNKYIFLWIPKNAGESIMTYLLNNDKNFICRYGKDLVSNAHEIDKNLLTRKLQDIINNYSGLTLGHIDIQSLSTNNVIIDLDKYFIFCFTRNPYDRIVSIYHYINRDKKKWISSTNIPEASMDSFGAFVDYIYNSKIDNIGFYNCLNLSFINSQSKWINDKVDFIGRFENLEEDMAKVCKTIGVNITDIPKTNSSKRDKYRKYYTPEIKKKVEDIYREDLDRFSYEF